MKLWRKTRSAELQSIESALRVLEALLRAAEIPHTIDYGGAVRRDDGDRVYQQLKLTIGPKNGDAT